jgi:hypothetical protein
MEDFLCTRCKELLPSTLFYPNSRYKRGFASRCIACTKAAHREWKEKNPERWQALSLKHKGKRPKRVLKRQKLADYLLSHPCVDCGESNILTLHFDHRDPVEKSFSIGSERKRLRWEVIEAEIAKCDVRCANCHAIRTAHQSRSWRLKYLNPYKLI